jgi:hypothetical protein
VFGYPDTVGKCGFITALNQQVIGFSSWDHRRFPVGMMVYNCIYRSFVEILMEPSRFEKCLIILRVRELKKLR